MGDIKDLRRFMKFTDDELDDLKEVFKYSGNLHVEHMIEEIDNEMQIRGELMAKQNELLTKLMDDYAKKYDKETDAANIPIAIC